MTASVAPIGACCGTRSCRSRSAAPTSQATSGASAQPVLIVTGADHHGFTPDQAREAVGMLAQGQLAVVPDAAYLVPLEAPEGCADLVLALWAGIQAGAAR